MTTQEFKLEVDMVRLRRNLTYSQLAKEVGISRNTLYKIMHGIQTSRDQEFIDRISEACGITKKYIAKER